MRNLFYIMLLMLSVSGCKSIQYVNTETVRYDSIYQTKVVRDSIYHLDSVFVKEKGDTIYEYRYKYVLKDKLLYDTLYISKVDSIQVPFPVEKKLTRWQSIKQDLGGIAMGVVCVLVIGGVVYFIKRKK